MSKKRDTESCKPAYPEPIEGFSHFGHVPLKGVTNCRDLGGLPCAEGRRIRPDRLMRSAALHSATHEDMQMLVECHGLVQVIDLRTAFELERQEDPISEMQGIEYVNLRPVANEKELAGGEKNGLETLKRLAEDTAGVFRDMYRDMVTSKHSIDVFARFLDMLLENESGATLWHCTQGKDRTGLAAMFAERALGASIATIKADYLATNLFAKPLNDRLDSLLRDIPLIGRLEIDEDAATYAQMANLDCALEAINQEHGSLDAFLEDALDFGSEKQARLRDLYLD